MKERRKQSGAFEEIKDMLQQHIQDEEKDLNDLREIRRLLHGNPETGDIGMVRKVNDMYEILIQAPRGLRGIFGAIILIGATLTVLKIWVFSK